MPRKISDSVREEVRRRAKFLCEYCHTDERWQLVAFTIDHVSPVSKGGNDEIENLCLACFHCNRRKSDKQFILKESIEIEIFNPRKMLWKNHFAWSDDNLTVLSQTEIGEMTIELLDLNRERVLRLRQADILVNRHPPIEDLV